MDRAIERGIGLDMLCGLAVATRNSSPNPKNLDLNSATKLITYLVSIAFIELTGRLGPPRMEVVSARILCKQAGTCIIMIADDSFASTDTAVEEGRAVCANMKQLNR